MQEPDLLNLLARTAQRDAQAFKELYDHTAPQLNAIALRILKQQTLAEDALQDTYIQIWHRAEDYHADRGSVMAWLTGIMRYRAIDLLRRNPGDGASAHSATETEDPDPQPDTFAAAKEASHTLHDCLARLSDSQRQSISLAYFEGLTHQELAARTGAPLGSVKSRIRRALQRLRECLRE